MLDGFIRVATASPKVRVGDVDYNVSQTVEFAKKAADNDCAVAVFPELGLTGYTCGDLFLQSTLLSGAQGQANDESALAGFAGALQDHAKDDTTDIASFLSLSCAFMAAIISFCNCSICITSLLLLSFTVVYCFSH